MVEVTYSREAARRIDELDSKDRAQVEASLATLTALLMMGTDLTGLTFPLVGAHGSLVAFPAKLSATKQTVRVEYAPTASGIEDRESARVSSKKPRSRDEALKVVAGGIGQRPDLPSGREYVKRVRGVWKGLALGRRDS
jgi:hypothetical protein